MFKENSEGQTYFCEACRVKARTGTTGGFKHTCGIISLQPSKEECQHEIEIVSSGGGDSNPLPCCKKCGAIVVKKEPESKREVLDEVAPPLKDKQWDLLMKEVLKEPESKDKNPYKNELLQIKAIKKLAKEESFNEGKIAGSIYMQDYADKAYKQAKEESLDKRNKEILGWIDDTARILGESNFPPKSQEIGALNMLSNLKSFIKK